MRALLGAWGTDLNLVLDYLEDPGRFHDGPDAPAVAA